MKEEGGGRREVDTGSLVYVWFGGDRQRSRERSQPVLYARHHVGGCGHLADDAKRARVELAEQAAHLTVFQSTATYTVPAHNRPLGPDEVAEVKANYRALRAANRQIQSSSG